MTITKTVIMPRELTAENGAKLLLSGEFFEELQFSCHECDQEDTDDDCEICQGNYHYIERVTISWENIKAIYAKAVERFGV